MRQNIRGNRVDPRHREAHRGLSHQRSRHKTEIGESHASRGKSSAARDSLLNRRLARKALIFLQNTPVINHSTKDRKRSSVFPALWMFPACATRRMTYEGDYDV